ncbi:methylenetetrahydrofolate reductase [Actinomyces trachealis]|uniref:methylenetetrahydrofolate reductase n=1 Tax=Actinomyces trachealis TaxID=2763540 RepID=UPI0018929E8A|nr:methylenetetrahydrofolate reductase [Actinomyces trachealis]
MTEATQTTKPPGSTPTLSMELFPPRPGRLSSQTWGALDRLLGMVPDFVSITYRPIFTTSATPTGLANPVSVLPQRNPSEDVITHVIATTQVPLIAHLTCIGYTKRDVVGIVRSFLDLGVRRFLALRGDPPPGCRIDQLSGELRYAHELVEVIREVEAEYFDDGAQHVQIAVAAYPAAMDHGQEVEILGVKQAAGADLAITQVFYDPDDYLALTRACTYSGVTLPILPGLMPLTDLGRLTRLESLTGVNVPNHLRQALAGERSAAQFSRGIDATLQLATDLIAGGAPGLHLYTFNRARPTIDVVSQLRVGGILGGNPLNRRTRREVVHAYLNATPGGDRRMP